MGLFNLKRNKRYFTEDNFNENYSNEALKANEVYQRMTENGFKENALATFDFDFVSDKKEKLLKLKQFLSENYSYTFKEPKRNGSIFIIAGDATELPINKEGLEYWVSDLYVKGYEFDCILSGYGALTDANNLSFLNLETATSDDFFKKGINELNKRNFGSAIISFSMAIQLDPNSEKSYQARGYCKDELLSWKAARDDYNKALLIDPNYIDALLIRATNKDNSGEHHEALIDYDKVIELQPENHLAYYNRGNAKFSLGDKAGACQDWTKSKRLGSGYAQVRLDLECK